MAHYRLYVLDREDHIRHAFDLECEDDEQAVAQTEARRAGQTLELWQGARRVVRFDAERAPFDASR